MNKLLFSVVLFLLAVSLLRVLTGGQPLTVTSLLSALSSLDLNFSSFFDSFTSLRSAMRVPSVSGYDLLTLAVAYYKWFQDLLVALFNVPVMLVREIAEFLYSVLQFVRVLRG